VLEICNWDLEESILGLRKAIGKKQAPQLRTGHSYSITDERAREKEIFRAGYVKETVVTGTIISFWIE